VLPFTYAKIINSVSALLVDEVVTLFTSQVGRLADGGRDLR
jgi:hypothetical protein